MSKTYKRDRYREFSSLVKYHIMKEMRLKFITSCIYITACEKEFIKSNDEILKISYDNFHQISSGLQTKISDYLNSLSYEELTEIIKSALEKEKFMNDKWSSRTKFEISKTILDSLDIKSSDILYDMGSGTGNFIAYALEYVKENGNTPNMILGKELISDIYYISITALSVLFGDDYSKIQITQGSALDEPGFSYSKGFVYPPSGFTGDDGETNYVSKLFPDFVFRRLNSLSWLFIDRLISNISGDWRAVALVDDSALSSSADFMYRDRIIKEGYLESITELKNSHLYLLTFSKNNSSLKLIDSSNNIQNLELNSNSLDGTINDFTYKPISMTEEPLLAGTILRPSVIIKKREAGIPLYEVADVLLGTQYTQKDFEDAKDSDEENETFGIIMPANITDDGIDYSALHKVRNTDLKGIKPEKFLLENDILITNKSTVLKTALYDMEEEKILAAGGIIIVRIKNEKINPVYLKMYFDSKPGKEQLKQIQKGNYIKSITPSELEKITIPDTDIFTQERIAEKYIQLYTQKKQYIEKLEKKSQEIEDLINKKFKY